jgi:hypothetical protein
VDWFLTIQSLKKNASRPRSTRPFVHEMPQLSIKDLKAKGLLRFGEKSCWKDTDGLSLSTSLTGKRMFCRVARGKNKLDIKMEWTKLSNSVVWYLVDPVTGKRCKTVYFFGKLNPKENRPVYPSQYQNNTFRRLIRMERLMLAIEGDFIAYEGPARGQSKLRKLYQLRNDHQELLLEEEARQKIVKKHPELEKTAGKARKLLKQRLATMPHGWDNFMKKLAVQTKGFAEKKRK